VEGCPNAIAAKTAQWAKAKIDEYEKVGDRKRSRSFITSDSSEETARHKKLESRTELLVRLVDGSKSMEARLETDAVL
jgi:hypothetical protein